MENFSKKKGFTLVEMMVVISIVALLSVMAVNGYLSYRKSALVNLSAENIVSQISAMKSDSTYGGGNEERKEEIKAELGGEVFDDGAGSGDEASDSGKGTYKCYGVSFFGDDEDGFSAKGFSQHFNGKKVWNDVNEEWVYEGCGAVDALGGGVGGETMDHPFELDSQIFVGDFAFPADFDGHCSGQFFIRFVPLDGHAEVSCDGGNFNVIGKDFSASFSVSYGKESENKKTVSLNLGNLTAEIK